jgi:hypothetical protein
MQAEQAAQQQPEGGTAPHQDTKTDDNVVDADFNVKKE